SYTTLLATQIFFPVGIAYAITRHDLFDIDAALRRTLAYAMISLSLLAIYLGLTSALTMLLQETHRPLFATVIGILIAALAFPWMSTRAQLLITRAFYPERLSFQRDIEAAQAALARVLRRDEVLQLLTVDLPSRLDAPQAGLSLAPEPPTVPPGAAWSSDLLVGGRRIGSYWLGARRSGLAFAPHEREWLQALAQQAALALAYAETVAELEALNRELEDRVTARTEQLLAHQRELVAIAERQRLARDLHDSLKQSLFSLGLSLHAARLLLPRDPEATGALLREQEALAIQAQSELGALLSDLREATPRRGDLAEALRQECARLAQRHQLQVTLDAPDQFILEEPARSELAAIAREALHNVLKHSGVGVARVQLAQIGDTLQLTVVDQGRGFDQAARASIGHGLRGMAERAAALGGTLTVTSGAGEGTRICAQIPSTTAPAL
ncbi:MAG: sensor histidine kinase, partial [Oscillochloris sp.]|nr:sensor histidine kinase [Oscillochloris sp.]